MKNAICFSFVHTTVPPPNPPATSTIGNQIPQDPLHPEDIVPLREKRNKEIREKLQDIVLDRSRVSLHELLQEGTFGKIFEAVVTGPEDGEGQNVLVKTVSGFDFCHFLASLMKVFFQMIFFFQNIFTRRQNAP